MQSLEFSHNWNRGKLNNLAFTTLRLSDRFQIGEKVEITLKGISMGVAQVLDKKGLLLDQITPGMAWLDTGYGPEQTKDIIRKMYPGKDWEKQKLYWHLLVYV